MLNLKLSTLITQTHEIVITNVKVKEVELSVRYPKLKLMVINCKFNFL